jgi:xanthine dehydrogenase accessory factor
MTPEIRAALARARAEKLPVVLATHLTTGRQVIWPGLDVPEALAEVAKQALDIDKSMTVELDGARWFLHVHQLPLRLFLIGAVHIAQALVPFAESLGLKMIVIDPRPVLATVERFPGITLIPDWPDEALDRASLNARSAVVALTHDPKLDDPALDRALHSDAFYIGALGSRRSHATRLERLAQLGHGTDSLRRIKGPVGLPIAAVTASEIALSIAAEIVAVRRGSRLTWARRESNPADERA